MYLVYVQEHPVEDQQSVYDCAERPTYHAEAMDFEDGTTVYQRFIDFTPRNGRDRGMNVSVPIERVIRVAEDA